MINKQENEWSEPYLRTDLPAEEHDRLVAELRADPHLLGKLLQLKSPEDENLSAALLFDDPNVPNQDALDGNIRRYLLRDPTFTDEKIGELEELMLEDERYFERVMLVENELIEDSLRGALSPDEAERFDNYFMITPERREKLAYVQALALSYVKAKSVGTIQPPEPPPFPWWKSLLGFTQPPNLFAGTVAACVEPPAYSSSWWNSFLAFLRPPNLFAGVAAASILLFVAVGTLWLTSRQAEHSDSLIAMAPTNEPAQYANGSNNLDQSESVRATGNVSSSVATPQPTKSLPRNQGQKQNEKPKPTPAAEPTVTVSRTVVFALSFGVSRSGGDGVEKKIEPGVKFVELRLPLDVEREYDDFRVVVQDSDGNEVARREKLKATTKGKLPFVTAAISAKPFKPDDYTVILSGGTKGVYQEAARYSFRVIK